MFVLFLLHYADVVQHAGSVQLVVDPGNTNIMLCVQFYQNGQLVHTCKLIHNVYYYQGMLNYSCDDCWLVWNEGPAMMKLLIKGRHNHHFKISNLDEIRESESRMHSSNK